MLVMDFDEFVSKIVDGVVVGLKEKEDFLYFLGQDYVNLE